MNQTPKRGLGKGFEALLPTNFDKAMLLSPEDRIQNIKLLDIIANPEQPRKHFDQTALEELAMSIKKYGVIQPILAAPTDKNKYIIVAGERRWRAAKIAKLETIPAVVHKRKELDQLEIALIENVQRVDLSPLETAISIEKLHHQFNLSYEEIGKSLGKAGSTVTNIVRLLNLPVNAKQALIANKISEGHARQILALTGDKEQQTYLLNSIIRSGWSVRQAEQFVTGVKSGLKEAKRAKTMTVAETRETKQLSRLFGNPVTLKRMAHGGKLEIIYKDDKDLARIIKLIEKK
ncbi:MAG TPA: ParB/RepB/Spo0J family partition protein [Candidatus Saccharimonadales bacterium]